MAAISSKMPDKITVRRIKIERSWERYLWLFMRLSGVAMLILAVGHMVIQHILNSSANLSLSFVAQQWSAWGWKAFDIALLWMAIPHGVRGLFNVLSDYVHGDGARRIIAILLGLFVVATVIWATIAIILFDPAMIPG
ncbi:succinate dehydrogenase [Promineifilum sp.]|uniref:succinate dehydrogenase n=1 Tax=Promineifilum sp. TaxID=2664178 RepID=UPI0035AFDED5